MTPANDNQPLDAASFTSLAERRAFLETAPATHAAHKGQPPCVTWAKREGDSTTFFGLKLWRELNEPPRFAANDNEAQDDAAEAGEQPVLANMDREMVDVSAKQLKYAADRGMTRWVGSKLVKVFDGHKWVSPEERFTKVRKRKCDKVDTEHFDAEKPEAQVELARAMDLEKLRNRLGFKTCTVLDMAAGDNTLAEIGHYLGGGGQYATRMAGKEVKAAVIALNAALEESEEAA